MKKITLTVASLLLAGVLFSQEYTPPAAAKTALKSKYPSGVVDEWYDEEDKIACYFEDNGMYGTAFFTTKGVWINSEFNVTADDLPESVLNTANTKYQGYDIIDATKFEYPQQVSYTIYIYNAITDGDLAVTIDTAGKVLKEEDLNADDTFE